jgi:predicted ABC-type ATPase
VGTNAQPFLHILAGPNGAGKSTLYETLISTVTRAEFVNADVFALRRSAVMPRPERRPNSVSGWPTSDALP